MAPETRLNTWTPLEQPWDTPVSGPDQDGYAQAAVISGAPPTDTGVVALFADAPGLFVAASRLASA